MAVNLMYLGRGFGAGATAYSLAKELKNAGLLKKIIISSDIDIAKEFSKEFSEVEFIDIPRCIDWRFIVKAIRFLLFTCKLRHEVILVPMQHPLSIIMLLWTRQVTSVVHDVKPHEGDRKILIYIANFIIMYLSKKLIVFSELQKGYVKRYYKLNKSVSVIKHPFSMHFDHVPILSMPARFDFLFFGRIEKYKGLDLLLGAFEIVTKVMPGSKLLIGGTGRENLPSVNNEVIVMNQHLDDQTLAGLLSCAEVVVLPYTEATQSGVLALAAQFGCKIVITPCSGLIEQLAYTTEGFVSADFTPESLAKAMIEAKRSTEVPQKFEIDSGVVDEFRS